MSSHSEEVIILTSHVAGWFAQATGKIYMGGYLMLGGRWVLDKIILPFHFRNRVLSEPSPGADESNA
jgi:hypothetical protein